MAHGADQGWILTATAKYYPAEGIELTWISRVHFRGARSGTPVSTKFPARSSTRHPLLALLVRRSGSRKSL